MKTKPRAKREPKLSQYGVVGRLIILHARTGGMCDRANQMHQDLIALSNEINKLREDLRVKVLFP